MRSFAWKEGGRIRGATSRTVVIPDERAARRSGTGAWARRFWRSRICGLRPCPGWQPS